MAHAASEMISSAAARFAVASSPSLAEFFPVFLKVSMQFAFTTIRREQTAYITTERLEALSIGALARRACPVALRGWGCQDGCRKWKNGRLTWKRSLSYIIVAVNFASCLRVSLLLQRPRLRQSKTEWRPSTTQRIMGDYVKQQNPKHDQTQLFV